LPALADAPLYSPMEISVDGSGNVYVIMGMDSAAGAGVYVYGPDGKEIKFYKSDDYSDLAIGSDGSLYLSNIRKSHVERIAKNGSSGIFWREDSPGRFIDYIATDRDGALYVSDFNITSDPTASAGGRILKISPNGTVTGVIESSQAVPMDRIFKPSVSDNGTIYMTDSDTCVSAIYPDGGRSSITPAGTGKGRTERLVDVAAGVDGYLYVTESTGGHVYKLAANGTVVTRWDGCGPARFVTPFGVATDGKGRVYVSDMQNQQVVWLDENAYRFGDDLAENAAGKGVLWGIITDANTTSNPLPGYEIMPRQSIPGYTAAIAFAGICIAGILLCLRRGR
jgi:sugar lactone lactonase YvrE